MRNDKNFNAKAQNVIIDDSIDQKIIKSQESTFSAIKLYLYIFFKVLIKPRDKVLKIALFSSFSILIITTLVNIYFKCSIIQNTNNLILTVFGSLIAAIVVEITNRIKEEYHDIFNAFLLRKVFSCDSTNSKAIIALSKYKMSQADEVNIHFKEQNEINLIKSENKLLDPHYFSTIAYSDAIAAANIASVFTKYGFALPKIFLDMEIIDELFEFNESENSYNFNPKKIRNKYKNILIGHELQTIICIGLYSNELTMWLNNLSNGGKKLFEISKRDKKKNSIGNIKVRSDKTPIDYNKWDNVDFSGKHENNLNFQYAIFARVIIKDINFLILGGQTALGTKYLPIYLHNNWTDLVFPKNDSFKSISDPKASFVIVYEIDVNKGTKLEDKITEKLRIVDYN